MQTDRLLPPIYSLTSISFSLVVQYPLAQNEIVDEARLAEEIRGTNGVPIEREDDEGVETKVIGGEVDRSRDDRRMSRGLR